MENWKTKIIDLGKLIVGKKVKIIFKAVKELSPIATIESSCGCSKGIYDKKNKELIVNYNPGSIPIHLRKQGWYNTSKSITITYVDGSSDVLKFKAKVYKKL